MILEEKNRLPEYGSFPVILSPYSNRGERIGTRISMYEEREREIIKYTCVINKDTKKKKGTVTILDPSSLERVLGPNASEQFLML